MKKQEKNYSWRGSPNAGLILTLIALSWAVSVVIVGFISH